MKDFFIIGSQSSPRTADLNNDGILDIVMGAGRNENQKSDKGVIAINGKNGDLLWSQRSEDQVYGSATFYDVTGDSIPDVFIGGRSMCLKGLDGSDGSLLWEYDYSQHQHDPVMQYARFNFNNNVLVPDQNNDGHPDLLAVNGGNSLAIPASEKDRFPAVLILFDPKSGSIIAADTMPDGKESYMSPVIVSEPGSDDPFIIFGTGGETISGGLYKVRLSQFVSEGLGSAVKIATEEGHGFIAPPAVADITRDGYPEVIAISHSSTIFAIDIRQDSILWKQKIPDSENSNSLAVGYFTADDVPDFFTFVSKGVWPSNTGTLQVMFDGGTGEIAYLDSMGCTGFSSPVAYDINGDGRDECIISINEFDCDKGFTNDAINTIENKLLSIDFNSGNVNVINRMQGFKNIFSTPLLTDLDQDGYLDLVYCQYFSRGGLLTFLGMRVTRMETDIKIKRKVAWGAYMGSQGDGVFYP